MDTETLVPPVTEAPAAQVESPEALPDAESVADHATQFEPEGPRGLTPELAEARRQNALTQKREEESGRFDKGRHRAQSQKAGVEDVKAINDLTRELRTKEAELARHRPESVTETPRIKALRRQIKAIESELSEVQTPKPAAVAQPVRQTPTQEPVRPVQAPGSQNGEDKEPVVDDFLDKSDPYAEWNKAWNRWDRRQEQSQAQKQYAEQQQRQQIQAEGVRIMDSHQTRLKAFAAKTPDFDVKTTAFMNQNLPLPLFRAIVESDNGPAFVYHLAQHPDLANDLELLTHGRDVNDDAFVASVQRRLSQHLAAVKTGSAPMPRTYTPPRPPNPVRTGSVQTSDDTPGEGSSIADHARYYSPDKR